MGRESQGDEGYDAGAEDGLCAAGSGEGLKCQLAGWLIDRGESKRRGLLKPSRWLAWAQSVDYAVIPSRRVPESLAGAS